MLFKMYLVDPLSHVDTAVALCYYDAVGTLKCLSLSQRNKNSFHLPFDAEPALTVITYKLCVSFKVTKVSADYLV